MDKQKNKCPECDGLGFHNGGKDYGVRCRCCNGVGTVTREQIEEYDRLAWPDRAGE